MLLGRAIALVLCIGGVDVASVEAESRDREVDLAVVKANIATVRTDIAAVWVNIAAVKGNVPALDSDSEADVGVVGKKI